MTLQSEILTLFRERRGNLRLRQISRESGVSVSTLSRFQRDIGKFDFENLIKIGAWCGMERFAADVSVAGGDALANIKAAIANDANLTEESRRKLSDLFGAMYGVLSNKIKGEK